MDKDILQLFSISDPDIIISDYSELGNCKYITVEKKPVDTHTCPECGCNMRSKGIYTRRIKHSILQGIGNFMINLRQKKWHCPNCNHYERDSFGFVEPYKQTTTLMPYMIINELKDINMTATEVALRYNVSDTYVHNTFMRYVNLPRLPLTDIIAIDEVYLNFDHKNRYALVIMDFRTSQVLDILPNRNKDTLTSYFNSISKDERDAVKYIVSDMYNTYLNLPRSFFKNAISIVDSFHVIQWINNKINIYINTVKKKYQKENDELLEKENYENNRNYQTKKDSREVYILKNFKWVLLSNIDNIHYSFKRFKNNFLNQYLDTYQKENLFLSLDPNFKEIRELKEKYISFNNEYIGDPIHAEQALDGLIREYGSSHLKMFREFSDLLKKYKYPILAAFTTITTVNIDGEVEMIRRISNGPMESFNNKPKDLKRNSNGVANFEYTRNRLLWATREAPSILAIPRDLKDIHKDGKNRGHYKKGIEKEH